MERRENSPRESAILVGLVGRNPSGPAAGQASTLLDPAADDPQTSLRELALLAETAGSKIAAEVHQRRTSIHPATFLSKGKIAEVASHLAEAGADLIIFDEDLSPAQARNLEQLFERKVIDRTELILDIFARRARTREAQVQVELAQLQYLLPRLTRMWVHLSRLGGGIGTRGPGETQLEVDRRRVRQRIDTLSRRLRAVERERETQRRRRRRMFRISLVGDTNAGKSTLFNALTRAGVVEEDQLFATLETTTRRLALNGGEILLLSDTVGFIRKLPHHLVASFRATLGEVRESDLLVHVVDASHPAFRRQIVAVDEVIEELLDGRPVARYMVLNKADLLTEEDRIALRAEFPDARLLAATDRAQALGVKDAFARALASSAPQGRHAPNWRDPQGSRA
jgi:GTP-binding protein HflX